MNELPLKVIICEDEASTLAFLVRGLASLGLETQGVTDGAALDAALAEDSYDIVVLDIGLPGEDGFSIAERLRTRKPVMGIAMLTSREPIEDRVRGLEGGADLYFMKPVDLRELASALRSLQRRLQAARASDPGPAWRLQKDHSALLTPSRVKVDLTYGELRFLAPLMEQAGQVVDRDEIFKALDQKPDVYAVRRLETMISRLRRKVQDMSPADTFPVRARRGEGYAFLADVVVERRAESLLGSEPLPE